MGKYSTLVMDEDKDAPKKKRDRRFSTLKEDKDKKGVWRTVNGRHVFIEEGKTLEQALGHKPGVENQKKVEKYNLKSERKAVKRGSILKQQLFKNPNKK